MGGDGADGYGRLVTGYVTALTRHHRKLYALGVTVILGITAVSVVGFKFMIEQTTQSVRALERAAPTPKPRAAPPPLTSPPAHLPARRATTGQSRARRRALTATRSRGRAPTAASR